MFDASALNTHAGPVASQTDKFLNASTYELSNNRRKQNWEERHEFFAKVDQLKRLTAGKAFQDAYQLSQPVFMN